MTTIDDRLARRVSRVRAHIINHFGKELERPINEDDIGNSIFWPGRCGKIEFCGTLFGQIGFTPEPGSTVGEVIEHLQAFEDSCTVVSG